jgi:glucose-1-phosphate thymidylyltransferase
MKGLVLAGGLGTRLFPLTKITNKHLLPVYDRPMIFYPIQTLINAGIKDIMIVTGGNNAGDFLRLLGNGKGFGLKHLNYAFQEKEGGIAEAVGLAEHFAEGDRLVIILGDNIIGGNIISAVSKFRKQKSGAKIMIKRVKNPCDYGVAELKRNKIVNIVEKPTKPKSNYAVLGIYMYDEEVFDVIKTLKPSKRGELEITDVNNAYIKKGNLTYSILDGYWIDAGASIDSLLETNNFVAKNGANKLT